MSDIIVVIPSLEPDMRLIELVRTIRKENNEMDLLVIDDGSGSHYLDIFNEVKQLDHLQVIHHKVNLGKGAALKTAMNEILENYPSVKWMVTIDSDGQHSFEDMMKTIRLAQDNPDALILGTRQFEGEVPLRSRFGNTLTRSIFGVMTGIKLDDTQTGLRVIPREFFADLLKLDGQRFEYETNMLIEAKRQDWLILSQTITTTYIEENASSHFRIIADSLSIYSVLIKYMLSSVSSFVVDIVVYTFLIYLLAQLSFSSIMVASALARVISSLFNYYVNRELVFNNRTKNSFIKYYLLVISQILLSAFLVYSIHLLTGLNATVIVKIVVDSFLFLVSYHIQKHYIFKETGVD